MPQLPGFGIEILAEIDSSNTELMRRARAGRHEPILLVAERQTAGRGRQGRKWSGELGDALTFSIGLPYQPSNWSGLSLAVGLSLAESLGPEAQLKWPNDLWCHQRKLGGILVEAASQGGQSYVVVGVGLNIRQPIERDLRTPAAAIDEFWPSANAPAVLERIIQPLIATLLKFEAHGFAELQARFDARDAIKGLEITCSDGLQGKCQGVDAQGVCKFKHPKAWSKSTAQKSV